MIRLEAWRLSRWTSTARWVPPEPNRELAGFNRSRFRFHQTPMVGDPGVGPGLPCSQSRRVSVCLASGGEGRNRTGSAALAGRARCLTCHPQGRRVPDNPVKKDGTRRHRGRPGCLPIWCSRYGGFNLRACYEARRGGRNRTRTRGFGDRCSAVELRP
jgi:hypothetical protein